MKMYKRGGGNGMVVDPLKAIPSHRSVSLLRELRHIISPRCRVKSVGGTSSKNMLVLEEVDPDTLASSGSQAAVASGTRGGRASAPHQAGGAPGPLTLLTRHGGDGLQ